MRQHLTIFFGALAIFLGVALVMGSDTMVPLERSALMLTAGASLAIGLVL